MTTAEGAPLPRDEHDVGTLLAALAVTVARHGDDPALRGDDDTLSWREYAERAARVARGLAELGVRRGDHVVLLLRNRPEFHVVDTACLLLGAASVSAYLSPSVDALAHVLASCRPVAVVAENATFLDRTRAALARPGITVVPRLVGVDPDTAGSDVTPLAALRARPPVDLAPAVAAASPADRVTMLYTSGTSGAPKGVPLTHANLLFAARTLSRRMGVSLAGRRQLSYLPMAHIGERLATHYLPMLQGSAVTCCPDLARMPAVLAATSPHMLFGAPRMWERLHEDITARLAAQPDGRAAAADPGLDPAQRRALLHDVLAAVGVADVRVAIVGSAPLPRAVQEFWLGVGVPLADCYGQTETCGMGAWNPHDIAPGTCGTPFDGMRLGIDASGEILVRGPALFGGYHGGSAPATDGDGWYHTGDLGRFDERGNLVLAGRRGDVLVPTSGHNVSPGPLEEELRRLPAVGHALVVGHGRPHLVALVTLDPERAAAWAAGHGRAGASLDALAADEELIAAVGAGVAAINERRPGPERIRRHAVLADQWPLASDLLTATGKMRRSGILGRYGALVDALYART